MRSCCPNCSQPYAVTSVNPLKGKLPLSLPCGDTLCEDCASNIIKFNEPLQCNVCQTEFKLSSQQLKLLSNVENIRLVFPIHTLLFGNLVLEWTEQTKMKADAQKPAYLKMYGSINNYIDVQEIINRAKPQKTCTECSSPSEKMCKQCSTVLCDGCFQQIHKSFVALKSHQLAPIGEEMDSSYCPQHPTKVLEYYCTNCEKPICMDCTLVGDDSCKSHAIVSIAKQNSESAEELKALSNNIDEIFRRLTGTALTVGNLLGTVTSGAGSNTELAKLKDTIHRHFTKLHAILQKRNEELIKKVEDAENAEKGTLEIVKDELAESLEKCWTMVTRLNQALDPKNIGKVSYDVLLKEAKTLLDTPWFLTKQSSDSNNTLELKIEMEIFNSAKNHISLTEPNASGYTLLPTSKIEDPSDIPPAPTKIVLPAPILRDVREVELQNKVATSKRPEKRDEKRKKEPVLMYQPPKFTRAKSDSNSSINSITSDVSFKTMFSPPSSIAPAVSPTGRINNINVQTVSPFSMINNMPLQKGRNEMIYVSHINDPSDFYVTRACYQGQIKEMMSEFKNAATFPRPQKSHISEGKIFLGYCQAEDMWHRCRIVNIDRTDPLRPVCHVFYIDYGQMDHLTVDKVREMAANRKQCPPPLALHCALANCHPITGVWTQDDTILMNQIINNKSAVMCIRKTLGATCLGLSLECDLVTTEDGVSLAHALVFHERARFTDPNMEYQKIPNVYTRPTLYCRPELKKGDTEDVMITHVVSPDKFYLRKAYLQDSYEKLLDKLGYTYDVRSSQGKVYYPEIGMAAVCNVDKYGEQVEGGGWRRAVVTALPGKKNVSVSLPDTGHEATVHWSALRHIQHEFTTLSALSFPCYLSGVSATSKRWTRGAVNLLETYANRLLKMCVDELPNRKSNSSGVFLYDETGDEPLCINAEFVKHNYAIPLGPYKLEPTRKEVIKNKAPVKKPMPIPKPKTVKILQKGEKPEKTKEKKQKTAEKDLEAQDKGPLKLEVKILSCASPSLIYVSILSGHELLEQMYEKLQEYYGTKKVSGKETWAKGDPCCVQCNKKRTWRRAVVEEVNGDKARVFYTDFAFVEWVNVADLKILTQEFMQVRDGAVKCHLSGIHPAIGDEWPTITREYLNELIESYQRFFITKQGVIRDKSLPIELWVYHVTAGGALEPNTHEWRKLNDRIIEQGLAITDRAKLGENKEAGTTGLESTEETLAFLNVKGSMSEWLQLAPIEDEDKPPVEVPSPGSSAPASPASKPSQPPAERLFSDWLPMVQPVDKEFIGTPTYVDEEARIYLHDVRQEDTLDMIRKSLNARFGDSELKPHDIFWSVQQPCIVKYDYDGQYYRGRVLKCHENQTCDVMFVDYGNVETCSIKNMRKNIVMASIPIQAILCNIPKIKPPSGTWDTKSLDFMHQLIVDKNCLVKVLDEPEKGVVPIDVNLNGNWLSSLFIELEFAIPSDAQMIVKTIDPVEVATPRGSQDSDPDYIIEEEESTLCPDSLNDSLEDAKVDWNRMVEDNSEDEVTFPTFATREPPALKSWLCCTVQYIHDVSKLEVTFQDEEATDDKLDKIIEDIQASAPNLDLLDGIFDDKACVAWSQEDNKWLRARIMGYDQENALVRVKLVDIGNIEMVAPEEIRECMDSWCALPPRTTTAILNGITISDVSHLDKVTEAYTAMFGDKKKLLVQVVDIDKDAIVVDVTETYCGPLVYQHLIDEGILIKSY